MSSNMLIIHGGGPTAVMNGSLYGAVKEAKLQKAGHIYAAIGGTGGLLRENLFDMNAVSDMELERLLVSPASAIGTSRDPLGAEDYDRIAGILKKYGIEYVFCNGGNGTMDTCGKIHEKCASLGIKVMGIPKTMDNDIAVTDHSPGYGSAARYIAGSAAEVCADVKSLPIHVSVIETFGRNAGWITAAGALAGMNGEGPDLIYVPERAFNEDEFLEDVSRLIEQKKGVVVIASEGLKNAEGKPIVEPIFEVGRATYFGDVGAHLANLVIRKLGYKARSEKPGILGRASIPWQSEVDLLEAVLAGRFAVQAALSGESGKMVGFRKLGNEPYCVEPFLIDISDVMLHERTLPDEYINKRGNGVTPAFIEWCKPLIGGELPQMISFRDRVSEKR